MRLYRITLLALLVLLTRAPARAQEADRPGRDAAPLPQQAPKVERDEERRVRVRLARGGKVWLGNRTTGRIVVVGWDNDYVEAVATSDRGVEHVRAESDFGPAGQRVSLKADYLSPTLPALPPLSFPQAIQPSAPGGPGRKPQPRHAAEPRGKEPWAEGGSATSSADVREAEEGPRWQFVPDEVHLEVKLPRYAELELITVNRSEVVVTGLPTFIAVSGKRSAIRLRDVGAVEVRTESGPVEVSGASGLVDVVTAGGAVRIGNVRGDVRALSLSGRVEVRCVRGRVNVGNTEGAVLLSGVDGDADATTVNGDVTFDGQLRAEGRYHLKSMSGAVEMFVRRSPPGFTALLSSYRGKVESDFRLTPKQQPEGSAGQRLFGRHGDGRAQITLDSFDGRVRLSRPASEPPETCR